MSDPISVAPTRGSDLESRRRYPRFEKGEVVRLTSAAVHYNLKGRGSLYGEVVRVGPMYVTVRRLDQKGHSEYWPGFWRHLRPGERTR